LLGNPVILASIVWFMRCCQLVIITIQLADGADRSVKFWLTFNFFLPAFISWCG
jgi:hypothetical protein